MSEHSHISDLRFDRLLAGELGGDAAAAVRADAAGCERCAARLAELTRDSEAFAARPPLVAMSRRRRGWWIAAPVVLAAAAAVVLLVRARPPDSGTRIKGGGVQLMIEAGPRDALAVVASGDRIHPDDYLQVRYSAKTDGFGAVLSRDGAGSVSVYVPASGGDMVALPAGELQPFPESTRLDDVLGDERVFVVWCPTQHALQAWIAEIQAKNDLQTECTLRRIDLVKERR